MDNVVYGSESGSETSDDDYIPTDGNASDSDAEINSASEASDDEKALHTADIPPPPSATRLKRARLEESGEPLLRKVIIILYAIEKEGLDLALLLNAIFWGMWTAIQIPRLRMHEQL